MNTSTLTCTEPILNRNIHQAKREEMKKTKTVICLLALMVTLGGCESNKKEDVENPKGTQVTTEEESSEVVEATETPSPTPEATPVPELSKDPITYGDFTEYFGKTASEVITAFDRPCRYDYWGENQETNVYGGFTFDDKVYFGFEYREENFNPSREVRALIIYNDKKLKAGIGGDLNVNMSYSEIKNVMGDRLCGPMANEDGTQYCAYGEYLYENYCFIWKQSPLQNDGPADSVMIYDFYSENQPSTSTSILRKPVKEYLEENKKLFGERKELIRKELRGIYQYEPICKYNLLTTIQADAHNMVEVYELAFYGCQPTYETKTTDSGGKYFVVDGVDRTKELYGYRIKLRLLSDGQVIDTYDYVDGLEDHGYDYQAGEIYGGFWWTGSDDLEVNALREMIGIPGKQKECVVATAMARSPVTEEGYDFAEYLEAYYLNGSQTPCLIEVEEAYENNDGDMTIKTLKTADGQDLLNGRKLAKEGTGTIYGHQVKWSLYDTPSGIQIVTTYTSEGEEWGGTWREYVILYDCLIMYYSFYSL